MALKFKFKLNLKNFDWKKFLLEKGEKVGLGVALFLGLYFLITSLFWPGNGLLATSPSENAKLLTDQAAKVENALRSNQPGDGHKPKDPNAALPELATYKVKDPDKYQVAMLFHPPHEADANRHQPFVLTPEKGAGKAQAEMAQLRAYWMRDDKQNPGSYIVKVLDSKKASPQNNSAMINNMARGGGRMPSLGGVRGMTMFNRDPDDGRKEATARTVPITQLASLDNVRLAEEMIPLRQAIIVAPFPYRKQLDIFRDNLRLSTYNAVLSELSRKVDERTNKPLPSFRFLGVRLQRRVIDALGHPLDGMKDDGWVEINLDDFVKYVIRSGKRTEKEDEALQELCLPGLVMPRLLQARELPPEAKKDEPRIENLPLIKATLEALQKAEAPPLIHGPDAFNNDFNPFSPAAADATGKATKPMGGMPAGKQPKGGKLKTTPNGMPPRPGEPAAEDTPPEYVLVRAIDVTVQPGTIYQYRIQIRMANPNFHRTDVSNPDWAKGEELKSDWLVIDDPVVVPPEMYYYAVDQKEIDNKVRPWSYTGLNYKETPLKGRQVAFQIHRWVENASIVPGQNLPAGEWAVAERILVNRGEPIGRVARVEIPLWKDTLESFVIPSDTDPRSGRKLSGREISFAHAPHESLLVDFEGPEFTAQHGAIKVTEKTTTEVLILTHDGKLHARDSVKDEIDRERQPRLDRWKIRLEEVKNPPKDKQPAGTLPFQKKG